MGKYRWGRSSCQRSCQTRGEGERGDGEGKARGGGGGRERETNRFFIFAFQAYLMIFPQTDRQTQRETYTGYICHFLVIIFNFKGKNLYISGNSLVLQLRFHTFTAKSTGSVPVRGNEIPQALWCDQKIIKFKNYTFLSKTQ